MSNYRTIFLSRATTKHGSTYNYSDIPDVFTYKDLVPILCSLHGVFHQKARTHAAGSGCPQCAHITRSDSVYEKVRHTKDQFVKKAQAIHGCYYDYTNTIYAAQMKKVTIRCPEHGEFTLVANNHVHGIGCAACKRSRGETAIENWLIKNGLVYETQKSFPDLVMPDVVKITNRLKYDFYLPYYNMIIEYDGKQHFEPVRFRGIDPAEAQRLHDRTIKSDRVKDAYATANGIRLLRISYKQYADLDRILSETVII